MAVAHKFARFLQRTRFLNKNYYTNENGCTRSFCTMIQQPKTLNIKRIGVISAAAGVLVGGTYAYYKIGKARKSIDLEGTQQETVLLKYKPPIPSSRRVISPIDTTGLKLTLFQYQTCPFCSKVRTVLDYYGISYDVVEVNPVLRKEIGWSPYKKVPILLTKVDEGYQPLNDSSMIISLIASHLYDKSYKVEDLANFYPNIGILDEEGNFKFEIINKYFLMFNNQLPKNRTINDITEERKWRKWADEVFVHVLSPNVYRTIDESYKTFRWFSDVGNWEEYFPLWERILVVNVGATAMWLIGKKLKKKHRLKNDVRQSLYDEANFWLRNIRARGTTFMGGNKPDLSDLAVYGVLKSIEGCDAFQDLRANTKIGDWYDAVKEQVDTHAGSMKLRN
ncbi:PREDICTED: prostaglandin E synthase 2 [Dinoponera quadriceps]|uniref:Prostaglandin E synthase 2 n=1 Tax=Dinoponera quadriceps TaxID=609295 RepID=A0A6P3XGI3_DINQU|nr:PREDICTED: prostaglandin E synthase 2 [Dinoponera quadriceps]